ncbi:tetratricopeptide repeat protein [Streptomyces sp. R41]|uniref:Tetratricopeptide repeat protein n=1 Tax=Streptomyces sp. R41 TaxID=3238632 RepID=A0AB39RFS1_9ACTN
MEIEERQAVFSGLQPQEPRGPRFSPVAKRVLIGVVVGGVVLGGVLVLLPPARQAVVPPSPGPGPVTRAQTAVAAGMPAALPDLAALIGDREAHLRAHPRDEQSWAVLGSAYVEQARRTATPAYYPKAEKALRTSLQIRPEGNAEALEGLAALADARSDFQEAKEWGEAAVEESPKRWTTYPLLIDAYTGLGDYKATRATLEKLQKLHSGPTVLAQASRVYWDRGWREDAAASIADAVAGARTPSEEAVFLQQAGELAWERGDPEQSFRYYKAALGSDPDAHGALAGQGRALAALGRTSEALRAYQTALAKRPAPRYSLELGELYEKLGLGRAARGQYDLLRERVRQENTGGMDDELVLGLFEADHGDPAEAVQRLRDEWDRHPAIPVADALGWALHRTGANEEALTFATKVTDKEHGGGVRSGLYMYHLGQIESSLDLFGPARRHLTDALRINPYFSPLFVPLAQETLEDLGEPPAGGPPEPPEEEPEQYTAPAAPQPPPAPAPKPRPTRTPKPAVTPAPRRSASR